MPGEGASDEDRFEVVRRQHEAILRDPDSVPDGWVEQARFRDRYHLPPFRPPRFEDDARLRTVVSALEAEQEIDVTVVARGVERGWPVEVDRKRAFTVRRYRDAARNIVVPMTSTVFRQAIREAISPEDESSSGSGVPGTGGNQSPRVWGRISRSFRRLMIPSGIRRITPTRNSP